MSAAPLAPLILTLKLDQPAFEALDALRQAHFPPERNFIAAHITLFHALPGDQLAAIAATAREICRATPALLLSLPAPRFLGRGVAIEVAAPELLRLRARLAGAWAAWLSAQDRQGYRPHVTIQNKVAPAQARQLYDDLAARWAPIETRGVGLLLWHYLGGPWQLAEEFLFAGTARGHAEP